MKKPIKITLVSLGSIIMLLLIAIIIAVWVIFNPKRLTPIVSNVLEKNIKCQSYVEKVELTFFSTFPNFEIKINNLMFKNPQNNRVSDTLIYVDSFYARVNPIKFIFDKNLIVDRITLTNGFVNLYSDSLGKTNFDVFPSDTTKKEKSPFKMPFDFVDLKQMIMKEIDISYLDEKNHIKTDLDNINLSLSGELEQQNGDIDFKFSTDSLIFTFEKLLISSKKTFININCNKKGNIVSANINSGLESLSLKKGNDSFIEKQNIAIKLPLKSDLQSLLLNIKKGSAIVFADNKLEFNGDVKKGINHLDLKIKYNTNIFKIKDIIALLPDNIKKTFANMNIVGDANLYGEVQGKVQGSTMPLILANIDIKNGEYSQKDLPVSLRQINGNIKANIDLSDKAVSSLIIDDLSLKTGCSYASINGDIKDLMNNMLFCLNINGNVDMQDIKPFLAKNIRLNGTMKTNIKTSFSLNNIKKFNLRKIKLNGTLNPENLEVFYNDSTHISLPNGDITLEIPSKKVNVKFSELIAITINNASAIDLNATSLKANIKNPKLDIGLSNLMDAKTLLSVRCLYDIGTLNVQMDTILADISNPQGEFYMTPYIKNNKLNTFTLALASQELDLGYGQKLNLTASSSDINGNITYDAHQKNIFLQLLPNINAKVNQISIFSPEFKTEAKIPIIDFNLTPDKLIVNNSRFVIKKSDFNLSGVITNISEYLKNEDMLTANLNFSSDMVDVYELMDLVSGFGAKDSVQKQAVAEEPKDGIKEPFMVPWNIDVILNTKVSHGKISDTDIYNLGGKLMIRDGVLVLEQMGFTCEAAKMQLTAIYRSERKNHLFAGIDFHLLDIEIDKLIRMIPQIDTIVPMLKYFKGKGEFHLAAETYLKSNYDIKYSTLRGASAIEGKDLVLLDNTTFNKLSKMLLFRKSTKNVIDSLSVEMTVFKEEVELFPFLIAMDKYKVVMQGIYNLSQNYKIKAETISPIKIGVDLTSSKNGGLKLDKLKLINLQYGNLFKPEKRNATQQQVMDLKKMIADALKANVKE